MRRPLLQGPAFCMPPGPRPEDTLQRHCGKALSFCRAALRVWRVSDVYLYAPTACLAVPTLLVISFVIFALLDLAPNDPTGDLPLTIPPEVREQIRASLALTSPSSSVI